MATGGGRFGVGRLGRLNEVKKIDHGENCLRGRRLRRFESLGREFGPIRTVL